MRRTFVLVLLAALVAGLAFTTSCKKKPAGEAEAGKGAVKTIGVSLLVTTHDFYKELQAGLQEEADAKGYKLLVQSGEKDVNKQITQMNNFVTQKVDAIIVCPADSLSIGSGVDAANKAGIPVFTADIRANSGVIVSHIASDNVLGGKKAGEYMANLLKDKQGARIGIIDDPTASSVQERVRGFKEEIAKHPNMTIVSTLNGQGLRDKALTAATNMLQAEQNLDAIFAINDDSAMGALTAAAEMKRDKLIIIGYDATPPAVEAICGDSVLKADVVQYPRIIGKKTIGAIADKLEGKPVAEQYPVEVGIVDKAELEKQGKCKK